MLRELRIQNFSVIDELLLQFEDGLTVFTGETGAGKSILVDAVELLVGGRASLEQLRTGCDEAVFEAAFTELPSLPMTDHLIEMGLLTQAQDEIIIRRIISRSGKNRIYLNGGLISLSLLQQVGEVLVDIHGQHEHQSLLKQEEQRALLDAYGTLNALRDQYAEQRSKYLALDRERKELKSQEQDRQRSGDFLRHQFNEIKSAQLELGEEEALEQERELLSNSEGLAQSSTEAYQILYEEDRSILTSLSRLREVLHDLSSIDPRLRETSDQTEAAYANLEDVAHRLRLYRDELEFNPGRLEVINDRFHLISDLKKKYGPTLEEVLKSMEQVESELEQLSSRDDRLSALEERILLDRQRMEELALELTKKRMMAAKLLSSKVQKELGSLSMKRATFSIDVRSVKDIESFTSNGADQVQFLISANPGEDPKPMTKVASGGELSRMTLALKVILGDVDRVPTLVFDEVDAGIGGAVAEIVGQRLKTLSKKHQVFCITHLPQIAALADHHLVVGKHVVNGRTHARTTRLEEKGRVQEIARMLGGQEITSTTLKHAREMLDH